MTKRRAIYGTAATSLSLARCCPEAQLLFDRLVSQADDQGRLQGDPGLVKASCMPLIERASARSVDRWLGELADNGMILRYEAKGQPLLQIVTWWDYQDWMRHAYRSRWEPPDSWVDQLKGSGLTAAIPPQDDGTLPAPRPHPADKPPPHDGAAPAVDSDSGGGESGISSESSQDRDAREASPPLAEPVDISLSRITTNHRDLTGKEPNPKAVQMYVDLCRRFGSEKVGAAQYRAWNNDRSEYGFVKRVKEVLVKAA